LFVGRTLSGLYNPKRFTTEKKLKILWQIKKSVVILYQNMGGRLLVKLVDRPPCLLSYLK
jgi:hypothetical protein